MPFLVALCRRTASLATEEGLEYDLGTEGRSATAVSLPTSSTLDSIGDETRGGSATFGIGAALAGGLLRLYVRTRGGLSATFVGGGGESGFGFESSSPSSLILEWFELLSKVGDLTRFGGIWCWIGDGGADDEASDDDLTSSS